MLKYVYRFAFLLFFVASVQAQTTSRDELFTGSFSIKKELHKKHPRLYITSKEIKEVDKEYIWNPDFFKEIIPQKKDKRLLETPRAFNADPEKNAQTNTALTNLAVTYRITRDRDYLDLLKEWIPYMENYEPFLKKDGMNNDLFAGSILYNFSIIYDMLWGMADENCLAAIRSVLLKQARATYEEYFGWKTFPFEQNHLIIPVCGLGITAMALIDEPDISTEAGQWGIFAHNLLQRSFEALSHDGWFFEGISYWNFTITYPLAYAGALRRCADIDFFEKYPLLKNSSLYLSHMLLPGMDFAFDFADWGPRVTGNESAQKGYDYPWHTYTTRLTNLTTIYRELNNPFTQSVVNRIARKGNSGWESAMQMLWMIKLPNERIKESKGMEGIPPYYYFNDNEVVHWRSSWTDNNATAIAFKSGPPCGHHIGTLYAKYPEWRYGNGHAHPDAGSFILFSRGAFVAGDTGYAVKESRWHNTITVDNLGQGNQSSAWATWQNIPYTKLDKIRMENVWLAGPVCASTAIFHDGYADTLQLKHIRRHLILIEGRYMIVYDNIEASVPRTFDWYLHTDSEAQVIDGNTWQVQNGKSLLTIQNIGQNVKSHIAPTIVETQLYPQFISRPQQRGYHLNLQSGKTQQHEFITAMRIGGKEDGNQEFKVIKHDTNAYTLLSGNEVCKIWIGNQSSLEGDYAYSIKRDNKRISIGIFGHKLIDEDIEITLSDKEQVVLYPQSGGKWKSEGADMKNITIKQLI
jgi:hypothetical protein